MTKIVVGVFDDMDGAVEAVDQLKAAQFDDTTITLIGEDTEDLRPVTAELAGHQPNKYITRFAIGGVVSGLIIGVSGALLTGTSSLLSATPLLSAISGAFAGGVLGALVGALVHFDIPDTEAKIYGAHLTSGKLLVVVSTDEPQRRAKAEEILDRSGAVEVDTKAA